MKSQKQIKLEAIILFIGILVFFASAVSYAWFNQGLKQQAEKLLQKNGYFILSKQKELFYTLLENDNSVKIKIVPDFIVSKKNKTYVVEVKTGTSAPSITNSSTRRQILEYYHVLDCDGVILLDMEQNVFKHIDFGDIKQRKKQPILLFGLALISLMGIVFSSLLLKVMVCLFIAFFLFLYVRK